MPKKKPNGEGSIIERNDGRWCAVVSLGYNKDGSRKRKTIYGKSYKEVHQKLIEFQRNLHINNGYIKDEHMTLGKWGKFYLFEYIKHQVRPSTFQRHESIFRVHIEPSKIATMKLKDIKPYHIQNFLNTKTYMVESSVKKIYQLLDRFFKHAVLNDLLWKNPMQGVIIPKTEKQQRDIEILTRDEQRKYMLALQDEFQRMLFLTALFTGMRQGELIALKWKKIDFHKGIITVDESYKQVKLFDENGESTYKIISQPPKTKQGNRKIPIPAFLLEELKKHRKQQKEYGMKISGSDFNPTGLVFCSLSGTPLQASRVFRIHSRICKNADIEKVSFHALRHTFASRMIEEGEDVKNVSVWLGHSTVQMTYDIYVHVTNQSKLEGAKKMDKLYKSLM